MRFKEATPIYLPYARSLKKHFLLRNTLRSEHMKEIRLNTSARRRSTAYGLALIKKTIEHKPHQGSRSQHQLNRLQINFKASSAVTLKPQSQYPGLQYRCLPEKEILRADARMFRSVVRENTTTQIQNAVVNVVETVCSEQRNGLEMTGRLVAPLPSIKNVCVLWKVL